MQRIEEQIYQNTFTFKKDAHQKFDWQYNEDIVDMVNQILPNENFINQESR